jgi:hypothetical protein
MPHPYTQIELEAMSPAPHQGVCGSCAFVDPANPTDEERDTQIGCLDCGGGGTIQAVWDVAKAKTCGGCGGDQISAFSLMPEDKVLCLNCRIQRHHDACRERDENDDVVACSHGWPSGS